MRRNEAAKVGKEIPWGSLEALCIRTKSETQVLFIFFIIVKIIL